MIKISRFSITLLLIAVPVLANAGVNTGLSLAVLNFGGNRDWGIGGEGRFIFGFGKKFGLAVSGGYLKWSEKSNNHLDKLAYKMTHKQTYILLGLRYYFSNNGIRPYGNLLYGMNFYNTESTNYQYDSNTLQVTSLTTSGWYDQNPDLGIGGGLKYPVDEKLNLDFNVSYHSPLNYASHVRILLGAFYVF